MKISPLISKFKGFSPFMFNGIDFIVLTFEITLSPFLPSPLVIADTNFPFS